MLEKRREQNVQLFRVFSPNHAHRCVHNPAHHCLYACMDPQPMLVIDSNTSCKHSESDFRRMTGLTVSR